MISLQDLLAIAIVHAQRTRNGSAELCIADAQKLIERGEETYARNRLLTSLKHSCGLLHRDYELATASRFEVVSMITGAVHSESLGGLDYATAKALAAKANNDRLPLSPVYTLRAFL